jgi:hypothetical protein
MRAGPTARCLAGLGLALVTLAPDARSEDAATQPSPEDARPAAARQDTARSEPDPMPDAESPRPEPRAFLIYLKHGGDPIVVARYVEEQGEIRFEKYGGWIGIPTVEVLKIVPEEGKPDPATNPAPPPAELPQETASADAAVFVSLRGGGNLKVQRLADEGERLRVSVPDGSFTIPRAEVLGIVRVPLGPEPPEAWISIVMGGPLANGAARPDTTPPRKTPPGETPAPPMKSLAGSEPPAAPPPTPRLPYESSDRPHFVRLSNGQLMRLEGFWVEDGQLRFRRLGGIIGVALAEIVRLVPEEIAPVPGRIQVRFVRQLGPDLLEVAVRSGAQRVRLLGVSPVGEPRSEESPWRSLSKGSIVYLEFDRERYDADGHWLAYVFLPNHRMLNAELIRLGLARPLADGRNIRYLDLFHELATGDLPDPPQAASTSK